ISTPFTRASTGSGAWASVTYADAATIATAAVAASAMRPGPRRAETDSVIIGIPLQQADVPPVRRLRRTVAQSTANRNDRSALNFHHGAIAALVSSVARSSASAD